MRFPLIPPPIAQESLADYLLRMFHVNGEFWTGARLAKAGLKLNGLLSGEDAASALVAVGKHDLSHFKAFTPTSMTTKCLWVGGVELRRDHWTTARRRWCPACWADDLAKPTTGRARFWNLHRRFWWNATAVLTCPHHATRLESICPRPECAEPVTWASGSLSTCRHGHSLLDRSPAYVLPEHTKADAYLVGRLGGTAQIRVPLLDDQTYSDAYRTMERFGAAFVGGSMGVFSNLSAERHPEILSKGFELSLGWPHAFVELLDRFAAEMPGNTSAHRVYGYLHSWILQLPHTSVGEEIRRVFYGHVGKNIYVTPGSTEAKYIKSAQVAMVEVSAATRQSAKTVRRYLDLQGYISPTSKQGLPIVVPVSVVHDIKELFKEAVSRKEAARLLGISSRILAVCLRARLLQPSAAFEQLAHQPLFLRTEIEDFLCRMRQGVRVYAKVPTGLTRITLLHRITGLQFAEICSLILDRRLKPSAVLRGASGLSAIYSTAEAVLKAEARRRGGGYTIREVALKLQMHPETVGAFIAGKLLSARRVKGGGLIVSEKALVDFDTKYVTTTELADKLGKKGRYIFNVIREAGVIPALSRIESRCRTTVFVRDQLPENLASLYNKRYPGTTQLKPQRAPEQKLHQLAG